jgi:glycosyltransferase involved in cell wall biosynthesis
MKILMLTPYLPYPLLSGGQIRTYNLLKKLAKKHEITLFALIKEESERQYQQELEKYCFKVKLFKRSKKPFTLKNIFKTAFSSFPFLVIRNYVTEVISAVEKELASEQYDLIHAETFYMMPHIPETSVPIILVEQTIEYLGYESYADRVKIPGLKQLLSVDINKIRQWEKHYWRMCDKLIVMSDDDKDFISDFIDKPDKIEVVSNGVDAGWFAQKERRLPPDPTILSVGTFKWLPNVEAVQFLVTKVWPKIKQKIPNAKLWIVGNAPTKEVMEYQRKDTSITVTGGIPDIRDAFKGAHVLLAPVFSGKGTRYKVLEAMASETPIVATTTAVEGLGVEHMKHVLTGDTATSMANLTVQLLQDHQLHQRLAQNSRKFVQANYDWKEISKKLDRIYQQIGSTNVKPTE